MLMPIVVQVSVISCSKEFHSFSPLTVWKSFIIIRFMTFPFQWRPLFSLGEVGRIVPDLLFLPAIYYFAYFDHAHLYSLFFCKHSQSFQSLYHSYCISLSDVS